MKNFLKYGEFKFQLQSFVKEHSSVNGLVNMDTVKSLYDMILDNARSYLPGKIEQDNARVDKISTDGCISVEAGNIGDGTVLRRWDNLARGRPRVTPEARVRANSLVSSPWELAKEKDRRARRVLKAKEK